MLQDNPDREQERLAALERYDVLDTPPEEAFDRITRLIHLVFDAPVAAITLVDGHRLWFKSRLGLPSGELPRTNSVCETIVAQGAPLVLADTVLDERFQIDPARTGAVALRSYAGHPLRTPEGQVIGVLSAADTRPRSFDGDRLHALGDLAQITMRELELRSLAVIDALTGALSPRSFREETDRTVSLAERHNTELSCIVFDIDHMRSINETFGHAAGDHVLRASIEACQADLRNSDLLGRIGGKRFGIVLPFTGRDRALAVAEKLRLAISRLNMAPATGAAIKVTASFGVAAVDRGKGGFGQLMQRASEAVETAKRDGCDRCVTASAQSDAAPALLQRVLKAGRIVLNGGFSTIDCTIRGLSEAGASIDVASTAGIPDRFDLIIGTDRVAHPSQIVLKRDRRIDLKFVA